MFILSNLIAALVNILDLVLTIFYWLIIVRALISWVNPDPFNPIVQLLVRTTEPLLDPIRRLLPPMSIDISPIIAVFLIVFLKGFLVRSLIDLAIRLR